MNQQNHETTNKTNEHLVEDRLRKIDDDLISVTKQLHELQTRFDIFIDSVPMKRKLQYRKFLELSEVPEKY